jgi:hypothetical protein
MTDTDLDRARRITDDANEITARIGAAVQRRGGVSPPTDPGASPVDGPAYRMGGASLSERKRALIMEYFRRLWFGRRGKA